MNHTAAQSGFLYGALLMLLIGLTGIVSGGSMITGVGVVLVILSLVSFIPVMEYSLETSQLE